MAVTSIGKLKLKELLPEQFKDNEDILDKKNIGKLFTNMAKTVDGDTYRDTMYKLSQFGNAVASTYGDITSVGLPDLKLPPSLLNLRTKIKYEVQAIVNNPKITSKEKNKQIVKLIQDYTPVIDKQVLDETLKSGNSFALQVATGMRGKPFQLRQLLFGDLLNIDSNGKIVPIPSMRSYAEGISPLEYWTASHGGRQGYVGVQFATADSGYFSKMVRQAAHRQVVTMNDCGKPRPTITSADDPENIGELLFRDVRGKSGKVYKANTPITEAMLDDFDTKKPLYVRSALTCAAPEGLCAHCAGIREHNRLPDIGESVGLNAVNSFLEPLGQSALNSKHAGGEASSERRKLTGLKGVYQFINMPETYVDGAVTAKHDGIVQGVRPAPQGGSYLTIDKDSYYIPATYDLHVKPGQRIEAGDVLTSGMVNMREVVAGKGLGEGRRIFTKELSSMLTEAGAGTMRRNIEALARGYLNKVEITDPDGVDGWIVGDIADYNKLESTWKPREGSVDLTPDHAKDKYLEAPVLQYTIGTRITPSVIDTMKQNEIKTIKVNDKEPPFKPIMIPARNFSVYDEDFLTSLSGENLMRAMNNHVSRGSDTMKNSVSYYPRMAFTGYQDTKPLTID